MKPIQQAFRNANIALVSRVDNAIYILTGLSVAIAAIGPHEMLPYILAMGLAREVMRMREWQRIQRTERYITNIPSPDIRNNILASKIGVSVMGAAIAGAENGLVANHIPVDLGGAGFLLFGAMAYVELKSQGLGLPDVPGIYRRMWNQRAAMPAPR